jgi:ubiquitin carboxyl-terminal hydrolase 4/11
MKMAEEGFAKSEHFDNDKKLLVWFLLSMIHEKLDDLPHSLEFAIKASQFESPQQATIM